MARRFDRRRCWASLSALASAALAASGGSGEAAIIYHGAHGIGPDAMLPLPDGNQISVFSRGSRFAFPTSGIFGDFPGPKGNQKTIFHWGTNFATTGGRLYIGGVGFRRLAGTRSPPIALAGKGRTFNQVGSGVGSVSLGSDLHRRTYGFAAVGYNYGPRLHRFPHWSRRNYQSFGPSFRRKVRVRTRGSTHDGVGLINFSRTGYRTYYNLASYGTQYALFSFDVGSQTDYGWLELSLGGLPGSAPFVRLIGYAYDTSGKPIPAGAIPEPQHLPLALGALALGGVGVREWRTKRHATA